MGKENSNLLSSDLLGSLVGQNVRKLRIPAKGGRWDGTPGNSRWYPDDQAGYYVGHGKYLSGRCLKDKYCFSSIAYRQSEPNFMPFADQSIGVIRLNIRPTERRTSYSLANDQCVSNGSFASIAQLQTYMNRENLVWHECGDGKTMIAIPMAINQAFVHTGGIGINKGLEELQNRFRYRGKTVLVRKKIKTGVYTISKKRKLL